MNTALVPLNPDHGTPVRILTRDEILDRLDHLVVDAIMGGNTALAYILERVVTACRGARGMDLSIDLLLFLEREQLLEVVHECDGSVRPRDCLDDLSPTGVFTIVDDEARS